MLPQASSNEPTENSSPINSFPSQIPILICSNPDDSLCVKISCQLHRIEC